MYARKHPRMRRASRFVGLAMIVGMTVALTASISTSPAQAARARRAARVAPVPAWTAYAVNNCAGGSCGDGQGPVTPINLATDTPGTPIPGGGQGIAITPNGATAYVTSPNI